MQPLYTAGCVEHPFDRMKQGEAMRTPETFDAYLRARGFDPKNPAGMLRRMFITCWGEPGFHAFWRLWNPYFGYRLFQLYLALGGSRRPVVASLGVFTACGFLLHDLPATLLSGHLSLASTFAFGLYWASALVSRALAARLAFERWGRPVNGAVNATLVLAGLVGGAKLGVLMT